MTDPPYLVCPACERTEPATERVPCPGCGSDRTYLNHAPALPDATTEGYVKFSAGALDGAGAEAGRTGNDGEDDHEGDREDDHEDDREDA